MLGIVTDPGAILDDDAAIAAAVEALKPEGADGILDLACLLKDLLVCRSGAIGYALAAARELPTSQEVIEVVREIASAPAPCPCSFSSFSRRDRRGWPRWLDGWDGCPNLKSRPGPWRLLPRPAALPAVAGDQPSKIRFHCPYCSKEVSSPESAAGKTGKCPGCGNKIKIPSAGTPSRQPDFPAKPRLRQEVPPCPATNAALASKDDGWSPELEDNLAQEAKRPLPGELETLAGLVGRLGHEYGAMGDAKWEQMKSIGCQLNEQGGFSLMLLVCLRAKELGGRHTSVSAAWDGIGKWQN